MFPGISRWFFSAPAQPVFKTKEGGSPSNEQKSEEVSKSRLSNIARVSRAVCLGSAAAAAAVVATVTTGAITKTAQVALMKAAEGTFIFGTIDTLVTGLSNPIFEESLMLATAQTRGALASAAGIIAGVGIMGGVLATMGTSGAAVLSLGVAEGMAMTAGVTGGAGIAFPQSKVAKIFTAIKTLGKGALIGAKIAASAGINLGTTTAGIVIAANGARLAADMARKVIATAADTLMTTAPRESVKIIGDAMTTGATQTATIIASAAINLADGAEVLVFAGGAITLGAFLLICAAKVGMVAAEALAPSTQSEENNYTNPNK